MPDYLPDTPISTLETALYLWVKRACERTHVTLGEDEAMRLVRRMVEDSTALLTNEFIVRKAVRNCA